MFLDYVASGFAEVFEVYNLLLLVLGVSAGVIAGAIPGFTITMAVVLTLPFTFGMSPVQGLSTMIGVFVGGLAGGQMSGMLTGIPGTPSSVATTFDGFPMARQGKTGQALGIGLWSSFLGGLIGAVVLVTLAPRLARIGLEFGPWDYFSLVLFALTITASLAGENLIKGLIAGLLGLLVAAMGEDAINGVERFTFGIDVLRQGFDFLPVLVGLFAFSQLLSDVRDTEQARAPMSDPGRQKVRVEHFAAVRIILVRWLNLVRSALIGVFTGMLPAAGSSISNILAYDQARKASRHPDSFGTGEPEGIIAPEASNNATAGGALITMMALGIPGDVITAVMLGALLIHNVQPSPTFILDNTQLAYSIFIAFFLAHFVMLVMQTLCLRVFLQVVRVPMYMLAAVILAYTAIGVFALNNVLFDLWAMLIFGVVGYVMRVLGFPLAPMILGVVLGDIAELNLSRALAIDSDPTLFLTRPWSLFFLLVAAFSVVFPWYQAQRERRRWTLIYMPLLMVALSVPLFMMPGPVRAMIGAVLLVLAATLLVRRYRSGWALPERVAATRADEL